MREWVRACGARIPQCECVCVAVGGKWLHFCAPRPRPARPAPRVIPVTEELCASTSCNMTLSTRAPHVGVGDNRNTSPCG